MNYGVVIIPRERNADYGTPVCYCHRCAGEIYDGELTEIDGFYYCPECAEETSSIEAAMAMDCAVMRTATEEPGRSKK